MRGRTLMVLLFLAGPSCKEDDSAPPAATLVGQVTDSSTQRPLPRVLVTATGGDQTRQATTSSAGIYAIRDLVSGTAYTVLASAVDYTPKSAVTQPLPEGETVLDFELSLRQLCAPGTKHCAGTPPAVLTCNAAGTDYASKRCGTGETCDPATVTCLKHAKLTVALVGTGDGRVQSRPAALNCPPDCNVSFPMGTDVTLTATPEPTSRFGAWGGACSTASSSTACHLHLTADAVTAARFDSTLPRLTVAKEGRGGGVVRSTPTGISCGEDCSELYTPGTTIVLEARPDALSIFGAWTRCTEVDRNRCTVSNITASKSIVARFDPFFEGRLNADANCRTLLHFDSPARLVQGCGGGADAVVTGTVSWVASRTAALGDALEALGPGEEGFLSTQKPGPVPPQATVELTVHRLGDAFEARGSAVLFSDQGLDGTTGSGFLIELLDDGRVAAATFDGASGTSRAESNTGVLAAGTWVHLAVVLDATAGLRIFTDGQVVAEVAGPLSWAASSSTAWAGAGREDQAGGATRRFNGRIDELRVSAGRRY